MVQIVNIRRWRGVSGLQSYNPGTLHLSAPLQAVAGYYQVDMLIMWYKSVNIGRWRGV